MHIRKLEKQRDMTVSNTTSANNIPLSIVITAHNQGAELERNLPLLLTQHYSPGFEIIVVDESSTDCTEDVLKQLKEANPHLYTTYIPASSHYISRRKLALTVGIKAAHNEWIILTDPDCHPETDEWLQTMAQYMTEETDVVCGYTGYEKKKCDYYAYRRMLTWLQQQSHVYRYDGANIAIRKSVFMARNGFLNNLQFLRGEFDFLVNETDKERITFMNEQNGFVRQEKPSRSAWNHSQIFYINIRPHLHRTFLPRLLFCLRQLLVHGCYLLAIAAIPYSVLRWGNMGWASVLLMLFVMVIHTLAARHTVKSCHEHIAWWKLPFFDLRVIWTNAWLGLKYKLADKNDFARK